MQETNLLFIWPTIILVHKSYGDSDRYKIHYNQKSKCTKIELYLQFNNH